jgi:hypothetical protein
MVKPRISTRYYTLVAGYMDPDKDILDFKPDPLVAIKRKLKEETGIEETVSVISSI